MRPVFYKLGTPLGDLLILVEEGLPVGITFGPDKMGYEEGESPPPRVVKEIMLAIESYFSGSEADPALAEKLIAAMDATPFEEAVLREVASIPRGETASYGEVAERAGYAKAARAVGNVMRSNPFPILIPCHRVIRGDGSAGGYGGGEHIKVWLLRHEGVVCPSEQTPRYPYSADR
jgi:methylated-DNA-[protein]-cysteine S-methyltransferase